MKRDERKTMKGREALRARLVAPPTAERTAAALEASRRELDMLPTKALERVINFEPMRAAGLGLAAAARLVDLVDELESGTQLGARDVEELHVAALALLHAAHARRMIVRPAHALEHAALIDEAKRLRASLARQLRALREGGVELDLSELRLHRRVDALPEDLSRLGATYAKNRAALEGKMYLPWSDVDRALALYAPLAEHLAPKPLVPSAEARAADDTYRRAAVLFMRRYVGARRAVAYLRPNVAEANAIIPPLVETRLRRKAQAPATAPTPEATPLTT